MNQKSQWIELNWAILFKFQLYATNFHSFYPSKLRNPDVFLIFNVAQNSFQQLDY